MSFWLFAQTLPANTLAKSISLCTALETVTISTLLAEVYLQILEINCGSLTIVTKTETGVNVNIMLHANCFRTKITPEACVFKCWVIMIYLSQILALGARDCVNIGLNVSILHEFVDFRGRNVSGVCFYVYQAGIAIISIIPMQAIKLGYSFFTFRAFDLGWI